MSDKAQRFYLSPVDYEAWAKGYTPPSEHVLIDELAHRGARVLSMCSDGKEFAFWIVVKGEVSTHKRAAMRRAMLEWYMDDEDAAPSKALSVDDGGDGVPVHSPETRAEPILPSTLSGGGEEDQGAASPRDHTIEPRQAATDQGGGAE